MRESTWTDGYRADLNYISSYYPELNPLRVKLAFLNRGLHFPEIKTACEIGYGQGFSTNIHASASSIEWYGTDFNPSQASLAQHLTSLSGSGAKFYDDSFADFINRKDLPTFDFIALHGIWSWVSDDNRQVLIDFIRNKLNVGGVFYIGYNSAAGWAPFAPMRHLLNEYINTYENGSQGLLSYVYQSLDFAINLMDLSPAYANANPHVKLHLEKLKEKNPEYLVHEYFNQHWNPMPFSLMSHWMASAKLQYACPARYIDHVDTMNLLPEQQNKLAEISDPIFRETIRELFLNTHFRQDYWVKGVRNHSKLEQREQIQSQKIQLAKPFFELSKKVKGVRGEGEISTSIFDAIIKSLSDYQPKSIGDLEEQVLTTGISFEQMYEALMMLIDSHQLSSIQTQDQIKKCVASTEKLNHALCLESRSRGDIEYLASPATGGGVRLSRFKQMFLLSLKQGKKTPTELAEDVWSILSFQKHKLVKGGRSLETVEENINELTRQAEEFIEEQLPLLKSLLIA